jgi:predicted RNase H-like HicB family nuclease
MAVCSFVIWVEGGYHAAFSIYTPNEYTSSTIDEALDNIKSAIKEWLEAEKIERSQYHVIEKEVSV